MVFSRLFFLLGHPSHGSKVLRNRENWLFLGYFSSWEPPSHWIQGKIPLKIRENWLFQVIFPPGSCSSPTRGSLGILESPRSHPKEPGTAKSLGKHPKKAGIQTHKWDPRARRGISLEFYSFWMFFLFFFF